ncbi:hypothetical protein Unana1_08507 [Umbelopsis nana]
MSNKLVIDIDPEVVYEYSSASNPVISEVPVRVLSAQNHQGGPTRVIPFDLSSELNLGYPATSPNLLVSFVRIVRGESIESSVQATSQGFYVIRGQGSTVLQDNDGQQTIEWSEGDLFTIPFSKGQKLSHYAKDVEMEYGGAALYWIHDSPLLRYLQVTPDSPAFNATKFTSAFLKNKVQHLRHDPEAIKKNRIGVLIGNQTTDNETKTLTHVSNQIRPPHRHNSVALDLCVSAPKDRCYTAMSKTLREDGTLANAKQVVWEAGAVFVTPPGWWHEHVNTDDSGDAWVLPLQDAGLVTHQRILDIRFAPDEITTLKKGEVTGISLNKNVAMQ